MDEQISLGVRLICSRSVASRNSEGMRTAWLLPFMNTRLRSASITGPAACVRLGMYRVVEGVSRSPDTPRSPHTPGD
jgi:hypothetical protein